MEKTRIEFTKLQISYLLDIVKNYNIDMLIAYLEYNNICNKILMSPSLDDLEKFSKYPVGWWRIYKSALEGNGFIVDEENKENVNTFVDLSKRHQYIEFCEKIVKNYLTDGKFINPEHKIACCNSIDLYINGLIENDIKNSNLYNDILEEISVVIETIASKSNI